MKVMQSIAMRMATMIMMMGMMSTLDMIMMGKSMEITAMTMESMQQPFTEKALLILPLTFALCIAKAAVARLKENVLFVI
jgi:hypothetical protein